MSEPLMRKSFEILLSASTASAYPHENLWGATANFEALLKAMKISPEEIRRRITALTEKHGITPGSR